MPTTRRAYCFRLYSLAVLTCAVFAAASQAAAVRTFTIRPSSDGGGPPVEITVDGGRIRVTAKGETLLTGDTKDGQKRKYTGKGGTQVAEVKLGEPDGFKVRTLASKLLWKIKTGDAKIKVSDNEENKGAFEIAPKGTAVRVTKDERLVGTFEFGPPIESGGTSPNATKIKDASGNVLFLVEPATRSLAGGVLLMSAVPLEHRYMIIAELLARNQ